GRAWSTAGLFPDSQQVSRPVDRERWKVTAIHGGGVLVDELVNAIRVARQRDGDGDDVAARHPDLVERVVVMHDEGPLYRAVGEDLVVAHDPLITSPGQDLRSTKQQPRRLR